MSLADPPPPRISAPLVSLPYFLHRRPMLLHDRLLASVAPALQIRRGNRLARLPCLPSCCSRKAPRRKTRRRETRRRGRIWTDGRKEWARGGRWCVSRRRDSPESAGMGRGGGGGGGGEESRGERGRKSKRGDEGRLDCEESKDRRRVFYFSPSALACVMTWTGRAGAPCATRKGFNSLVTQNKHELQSLYSTCAHSFSRHTRPPLARTHGQLTH